MDPDLSKALEAPGDESDEEPMRHPEPAEAPSCCAVLGFQRHNIAAYPWFLEEARCRRRGKQGKQHRASANAKDRFQGPPKPPGMMIDTDVHLVMHAPTSSLRYR